MLTIIEVQSVEFDAARPPAQHLARFKDRNPMTVCGQLGRRRHAGVTAAQNCNAFHRKSRPKKLQG